MYADVGEGLWDSEQIITARDSTTGLRAIVAIDDTTLGPGFGGVRRRSYPSTAQALSEVKRLAAAMTYKHALAGLPYGGAKAVILEDPNQDVPQHTRDAQMGAFARFVARTAGSYIPGVDMGTTPQDMQLIARSAPAFCDDVDPGPYTAQGVYAAMRAAVRHRLGRPMDGIRLLVQGVGHVGASLARRAAADGAVVSVSDVDLLRAQELAAELGAQVLDPAEVLTADVDVLAPCAIARVVTLESVPAIRASVIAGAANDPLDTPEVAEALRQAQITYVPDFAANSGGVIQVHSGQAGWSAERLDQRLEGIGDVVAEILTEADQRDISTLAAARHRAHRRLEAGRAAPDAEIG